MRYVIAAVFIVILQGALSAQVSRTIRGALTDSTGQVLPNATVSLFTMNTQRDSLYFQTDMKGSFIFSSVSSPDFKIKVTSAGYADFNRIFHYPDTVSEIILPSIQLSSIVKTLEEVIVTVDRTVTIKEDTIEFKADSFKVRADADVEALLKKIPGIQVDANGNITAHGKSVSKIRVNGKDFFSGDIKTATKELPANIVDLVQVIDDYGDQAAFTGVKEGDPDKIINIQIKKDKNKGHFGRGQAGVGTNGRYTVNGSINHFNNDQQISLLLNINNTNTSTFNLPRPGSSGMRSAMAETGTMNTIGTVINNGDGGFIQSGQVSNDGLSRTNSIGLNYRDDWGKKFSVYGSYTFSDKRTLTLSNTKQTNGSVISYQNNRKTENNLAHRIFLNADWKIDSFNQVKISPTLTFNRLNSSTYSDFVYTRDDNSKLNEGLNTTFTNYTQPSIGGSILYNHRFRKSGRFFSATVNKSNSGTEQEDDQVNNSTFYLSGGGTVVSDQHQIIKQDNPGSSASIRLSYIEPLTKKRSIELNYTNSSNNTDNDKQTYLVTNGNSQRLDSLSNIYESRFNYNRFGLNYRYNDKKYNYSIGLAAQSSEQKGESFITKNSFNQKVFNWFPMARFTYNFSRSKSVSVNYTSSITAPTYSQLQPVYDYSNPQYPVIGNPDLKPEFRNTFSARFNKFDFVSGNVFFSNLNFSWSRDKVVANSIDKFNTGGATGQVQETRYLNADGYYNANGFYHFSKPFQDRKYTVNMLGNINYANDISFLNDLINIAKNFSVTQGLNMEVKIKKWLELGSGASYAYNQTRNSLTKQSNSSVNTFTISSNSKIYLPGKWVFSYDLNKSFNSGYGVTTNPFIINGYLEKQMARNSNISFRLQAFDLLNQNSSISRSVTGTTVTDTRTNRLGQYFMLSINFRLQKFKGQQPAMQLPRNPPTDGPPPFQKN